jgi:hypothetical protein
LKFPPYAPDGIALAQTAQQFSAAAQPGSLLRKHFDKTRYVFASTREALKSA